MIRFTSDYCEGAHPTLLTALADTNLEGNPGYGTDDHCQAAARMLCRLIGRPDAQVHFLTGGTDVYKRQTLATDTGTMHQDSGRPSI